jgi:hypothetical protein
MTQDATRYQFGPLERHSFVAGLSLGQVGVCAAGLLATVVFVRRLPTAAGFLAALAVLAVAGMAAFWQVAGRTPQQWLPVVTGWVWRRATGRTRYRADVPLLGFVDARARPTLPDTLAGVRILSHTAVGLGQAVGVVHDARAGAYTAVLVTRGRSFELASLEDKQRRLEAWGMLLAGLARAGSPVTRLQWVERTAPDDGDALGRYLTEAAHLEPAHPAAASYQHLITSAGPASQPHEVLLAVTVSAAAARRAIKAAGGGDAGACAVLVRELRHLGRELASSDITFDDVLSPRMLAQAIRVAFDPGARGRLARRADGDPEQAGTTVANAWPLATDTLWGAYRTEDAWHMTYWVAQWPRLPVGPDFLAYLLLGTTVMRTVSVTMAPVPAGQAHREVEQAMVQGLADDELRARAGFMGTARRRREREAVARREEELAVGHADYRVSGYVTVTAADPDQLQLACGEIEQAAERSRLELRRLYGQQDIAFTHTLPLGRGVA